MARALADHASLVLGCSNEHVKHQAMNEPIGLSGKVALRFSANANTALSCGRSLRFALSTSTKSAICSPCRSSDQRYMASRCASTPNPVSPCLVVDTGQIADKAGSGISSAIARSSMPPRKAACFWTTEKIRALVDNIGGKKDRDIEGEVVNKDDEDG